jgi:hypothetical protein
MKPPVTDLVQKIEEAKGNISAVARAYGRPRSTVYSWIEGSVTAQQAIKDQRELVVDVAENRLFGNMNEGDNQAIFYILNNMKEAKDRGWGNKLELEHSGAVQIARIRHEPPKDN